MCDRKPSQPFFQDGALPEPGRILVYGSGVLTDVVSTGPITPATTPLLVLRDGQGPGAKILLSLSASGQPFPLTGMNLEFQEALWMEYTPGAGPLFGKYSIGAYVQDDTPDPMAVQLERVREAVLAGNKQIAEFVYGLMHGNPST